MTMKKRGEIKALVILILFSLCFLKILALDDFIREVKEKQKDVNLWLKPTLDNFMREVKNMKTEEIKNLFAYVLGKKEVAFQYLGYSGVVIRTPHGAIIIDPADKIRSEDFKNIPPGSIKLVLFTHDHYDHFHQATAVDLFKVTQAPIFAETSIIDRLRRDLPAEKLFVAEASKTFNLENLSVTPVRGAHVGPILLFHIKIIDISIFHGGDSDYVPLQGLSADLAFLPTGDPSPTASPYAALKMALDLKPRVIVAIHGSARQHKELEKLVQEKLPQTRVMIPAAYAIEKVKLD